MYLFCFKIGVPSTFFSIEIRINTVTPLATSSRISIIRSSWSTIKACCTSSVKANNVLILPLKDNGLFAQAKSNKKANNPKEAT
jgi:hypothetical protein